MNFLFGEKPLGNRHQQQKEKEKAKKTKKKDLINYLIRQIRASCIRFLFLYGFSYKETKHQANKLSYSTRKKAPSNLSPI